MSSLMGCRTAIAKTLSKGETLQDNLDKYAKYRGDIPWFMREILGIEHITKEIEEVARSLIDNYQTNVQSAHGMGKTFFGACSTLYWVLVEQGLVITTAPTNRQVETLLWREIRTLHARNNLPGKPLTKKYSVAPNIMAYGFTANDNNSDAFQGVHEERLLVILDEACGISNILWEGAESCATDERTNRLLAIGNPTDSLSAFSRACQDQHIKIPAFTHPNVNYAYDSQNRLKEEYKKSDSWKPPLIPGAISIGWIEKQRKKYGESSNFWRSRILAEFSASSGCSILPSNLFEQARARYDENPEYWDKKAEEWHWSYGADVGDVGDAHAIARWKGNVLYSVEEIPTIGDGQDTLRLAKDYLLPLIREKGGTAAIDSNGIGAGTLAYLLQNRVSAIGFKWGESPTNERDFCNLKTEQFWLFREAMTNDIAIAPLGEYEESAKLQFNGYYYEENPSNLKLRMEPKTKTRERLGQSPDLADAIVYGFHARYFKGSKSNPKKARKRSNPNRFKHDSLITTDFSRIPK